MIQFNDATFRYFDSQGDDWTLRFVEDGLNPDNADEIQYAGIITKPDGELIRETYSAAADTPDPSDTVARMLLEELTH